MRVYSGAHTKAMGVGGNFAYHNRTKNKLLQKKLFYIVSLYNHPTSTAGLPRKTIRR